MYAKEIIAIGGGKGGTGKSVVALNIGTMLANKSKKTVVIDLDLGSANIHTMLGIHYPQKGISDFFFHNDNNVELNEFVIKTPIKNLFLIAGNEITPGMANLEYQRKQKLIREIKKLDYDYIILDLGAGSHFNIIDYFNVATKHFLVTLPEPTSILNTYEFLKNCIYRKITEIAKQNANSYNVITKQLKTSTIKKIINFLENNYKDEYREVINYYSMLNITLILNKTGDKSDISLKLKNLINHFLKINIHEYYYISENKVFIKAISQGVPVINLDDNVLKEFQKIKI